MFVVDTNILVYAADRDSPGHDTCRKLLGEWRNRSMPWYITWGIAYEFLRVVTHPNVFRKPLSPSLAWRFLYALLASPSLALLTETEHHAKTLAHVLESVPAIRGNLVFDAHTATLMREHGITRIYTHDADFNRFPWIEVVDPI